MGITRFYRFLWRGLSEKMYIYAVTHLSPGKSLEHMVDDSNVMSGTSHAPTWEDILPEPFAALILGQRGSGKTALGHLLLEKFGDHATDRDAYILGFPEELTDELPSWVEVLSTDFAVENWPEDSVVLVHEAHHLVHARRSMDAENLELDTLLTVSRHKNSDVIFETQQSQRLDRNMITAVDAVIFREPALMQADFERSQLATLTKRAEEVFEQYVTEVETEDFTWREKSNEVVKHAYIYSGRFEGEYPHEIPLADHYTEAISKAYGEAKIDAGNSGSGGDDGLSDEERKCLKAGAEWEEENRPLSHKISGFRHDDMPVPHAWNYLTSLCGKGLAEKVYDSNSDTTYRLTDDGWDKVNHEKPDAPVVADE